MSTSARPQYEVVVVGGLTGLTTAPHTTRLGHRTAVFEGEGGRHAAFNHVHIVLGISEDGSGRELADHPLEQVETYGGDIYLNGFSATIAIRISLSRSSGKLPRSCRSGVRSLVSGAKHGAFCKRKHTFDQEVRAFPER